MPVAVQAHLCKGFSYGNAPAHNTLRLQYSTKVRRLDLIEPGEFLHLRSLEPRDDLVESGGDDVLGFE